MYHSVQILTLLIITQSVVQCQNNETCKGVCMELADCPSQLRDVQNKTLLQSCAHIGTEPVVCCPLEPGLISKQKCKEYKQLNSSLGQVDLIEEQNLITEFPYMVALGYEVRDLSISWRCGGILISEEYVLIAAHCAVSPIGPLKFVRMGTGNLENPGAGDEPQDFEISKVIVHPSFKPRLRHDIALIKLNTSAVFNSFVRPACLQTDYDIIPLNYIETVWEHFGTGNEPRSQLVKENLVPYAIDICRRIYANVSRIEEILEDSQICTVPEGPQKDICKWYSGGSLQVYRDGSYHVVGLTSFGTQCGLDHFPAVYTRVSKYISWIEDIVWPSP